MELLKVCKCIYCGKGDNLVCCDGIECPVCVHLKCVGKVNVVVENEKFYCAYCCYKREVSVCVELLRKKETAEKNLESFLNFKLGSCSDGGNEGEENGGVICELVSDNGGGGDGEEENMGEENGAKEKTDKENGGGIGKLADDGVKAKTDEENGAKENTAEKNVGGIHKLVNDDGGGDDGAKENVDEDNGGVVHKLVSDDGGVRVGGEEHNADEKNADFILVGDDDDVEEKEGEDNGEGNDQKCDERVVEGEKPVETNLVSSREDGGDDSISDWDSETLAVYCRHRQKSKSPLPLQSVPPLGTLSPRQQISKSKLIEEKKVSIPEQHKKSEESPIKSTNMQLATAKRKRSYWTSEEEETLKEGVHKFSSKINKNIPWKKILDFGRHIFDSGRTPADLKDKWRTMNK